MGSPEAILTFQIACTFIIFFSYLQQRWSGRHTQPRLRQIQLEPPLTVAESPVNYARGNAGLAVAARVLADASRTHLRLFSLRAVPGKRRLDVAIDKVKTLAGLCEGLDSVSMP